VRAAGWVGRLSEMSPVTLTAAQTPSLDGAAGWAVELMEALGVVGAGIAVALANFFPPVPSEVILPLAGFTASQGSFGYVEAVVWTTFGSVVGSTVLYLVGAAVGRDRTRRFMAAVPLVSVADVDTGEAFFLRHGKKAVLLGCMVPVVRTLVSIPAGVERMSLGLFMGLTGLGSLLWNTLFVTAGFLLGERWYVVEAVSGPAKITVISIGVLLVLWFVVVKVRARRLSAPVALPDPS
jgi:membrane protein DedA with SNARE-associated domain